MERIEEAQAVRVSVAVASTLATTYTVMVYTPCLGSQTVTANASGSSYSGNSGDFDIVNLYAITVNGQQSWEFVVHDYQPASSCFGIRRYRLQVASSDPVGLYVGSGGATGAVLA